MAQICFEVADIYKLGDDMYAKFLSVANTGDKWVSGEEAMRILHIGSKTTLQRLRDEGKIRFYHDEDFPKNILYDRDSILEYFNKHSNKPE